MLVLTNKYWDGNVPKQNNLNNKDKKTLEKLGEFPDIIGASIENFKFREALIELINLARLGNKYLAENEPWKLKNTDEKRTETIMNVALQITASLAILSHPFLPFSSKKLKEQLGIKSTNWNDAGKIILKENHKIKAGDHLFKKIEDQIIQKQIEKLKS